MEEGPQYSQRARLPPSFFLNFSTKTSRSWLALSIVEGLVNSARLVCRLQSETTAPGVFTGLRQTDILAEFFPAVATATAGHRHSGDYVRRGYCVSSPLLFFFNIDFGGGAESDSVWPEPAQLARTTGAVEHAPARSPSFVGRRDLRVADGPDGSRRPCFLHRFTLRLSTARGVFLFSKN